MTSSSFANLEVNRDPLDRVPIAKLKEMWRSLAFLCPKHVEPIFGNNRVFKQLQPRCYVAFLLAVRSS